MHYLCTIYALLSDTPVKHRSETPFRDTLAGHSHGALDFGTQNTLYANTPETLPEETLLRHSCGTLLQHTL